MSLRLSLGFRGGLAIAVLVGSGLGAPIARAQDRPPALEAEAPHPAAATNATPAAARTPLPKNGLLRLEEQLSRSFQFLKPSGSSLEGMPAPPMPARPLAPVPTRRTQDLLNDKKNWVFMNPDELTAPPKPEDLLNMPDYRSGSRDKSSLSAVERFYQDLGDRAAAKGKKRDALSEAEGLRRLHDELRSTEDVDPNDPTVPETIRKKALDLKKALGLDASTFAPPSVHGSFSDIFGFGEQQQTKEEELAHKAYINSFNEWLNRSTATTPNSGIVLPPGATDPTRPTVSASGTYSPFAPFNPSSRPNNYDPTIGTVNPTLAVSTPQDITTKVLNQWNPYYVPPKVEPPRTPPPAPVFDTPQRKFP